MIQPIILDMQVLSKQAALRADASAPNQVDKLLAKLFGASATDDKGAELLFSRAAGYDAAQPNFADELRIAGSRIQ